jgi:hypothetical protein
METTMNPEWVDKILELQKEAENKKKKEKSNDN